MDELISVIVPIYNVEKYLTECLYSILNQSYKALEIILIDDGSTDSSGKICDEFAEKDKRVLVFHKKNTGLSDARNIGIDLSKGLYIAFCDADDYLHHNFIQILYDGIVNFNADICCCNYKEVYEYEYSKNSLDFCYSIMSGREALYTTYMAKPNRAGLVVWNKLYKKSILATGKVRFPVGKLHEDEYFSYKILYKAKTVALVDVKLYFYRQREDSITHNKLTEKNHEVFIELVNAIDYFIFNGEMKLAKAALYYYVSTWWRYFFKENDLDVREKLIVWYINVIKKYVKLVRPSVVLTLFYYSGLIDIRIPYIIKIIVQKAKIFWGKVINK